MSGKENCQAEGDMFPDGCSSKLHRIDIPSFGEISVYVQGTRTHNEVVILTVHDVGCDQSMYEDFVSHPLMMAIRDRTVWMHVQLPGQGQDADDLAADYIFPTMTQLGEDLIYVLDSLKVKEVVCFGEGAGANILARFAMAHLDRVLGVCLTHCTGTTAGIMESLKDKMMNWKLDHIGMNPTAEAYLVLHRFGEDSLLGKAKDRDQLKAAIENYQTILRSSTNPKNLKKFVESFLKYSLLKIHHVKPVSLSKGEMKDISYSTNVRTERTSKTTAATIPFSTIKGHMIAIRTNIADKIKRLTCPVLFMAGQKSMFNNATHSLYQTLMKQSDDKTKVEFVEVEGVANVLEEKPEKMAECFQYFLQGLGLVSSVPMHHVMRMPGRLRSMSMEEYDRPKLRSRSLSGGSGTISPLSCTPPAPTAPTAMLGVAAE